MKPWDRFAGISRRVFLVSGVAALANSAFSKTYAEQAQASQTNASGFRWQTGGLTFPYAVRNGRLRQGLLTPADRPLPDPQGSPAGWGVETALLYTGENSSDPGMKEAGGMASREMQFVKETRTGSDQLTLEHHDPARNISVISHYEAAGNLPVVRKYVEIRNQGTEPVGLEYLSSAMLHGFADPTHFNSELRIWIAYNSWMSEGQWHCLRPSEMGFVENERTSWSEAWASSVGGWSSEKFIPMAVVENTRLGLSWFWQIEHNGSWHWEISNVSERGNRATDVYAYIGGPDQLHSQAWKNLAPGAVYKTVPVAIGCVKGGFEEAVDALTQYRKNYCMPKVQDPSKPCPVIFNDYMNCLTGDPTEAKELPLIDAAAAVGCEYYVIDAGWYAELNENWSATVGSWIPSKTRWPRGLQYVLDYIRQKKMIPGLWLETEVVGMHSELASKPDNWFLMRHGKRVIKNSRLFLDFRNAEVRAHLDGVLKRLVEEYGVGYIKMDYNADTLEGTDLNADSVGQGLLDHNRAVRTWLLEVGRRYPKLVIENCGSGGGRMDYAMLSCTHLQSCTDQEDYLRLPAIVTGSSAAVVPMQLAVWAYPTRDADADQASFNMVSALLCRIHQSGHLASLRPEALAQVKKGIDVYKSQIRDLIPDAVPFYPLGMPDVHRTEKAVCLGMKSRQKSFIAVWRLEGSSEVNIEHVGSRFEVLYPNDLGIDLKKTQTGFVVTFPRPRMGCIVTAHA